jgi:hypothetical protein
MLHVNVIITIRHDHHVEEHYATYKYTVVNADRSK